MEGLIELKNINDEHKAISFLYDLVNNIYERDNFLPILNDFLLDFLKMNFDLQLHHAILMITNSHKNSIIKTNRDLIMVNAKKLATEELIIKQVKESEHKKEIDFLLKGLEGA